MYIYGCSYVCEARKAGYGREEERRGERGEREWEEEGIIYAFLLAFSACLGVAAVE